MKRLLAALLLLCSAACFGAPDRIEGTILPSVLLSTVKDTEYVYITVLARTGPANESNSTGGFSALIASMLLNETKNRTGAEMEEVFYRINGSMNITTTLDTTEIRLLTSKKNLMPAMRILGDCLTQPKFTAEAVAKARDNAFAGLVSESGAPFQQAYDRLRFSLYGSGPYKRSFYGSATAISKATPKQLYAFFNENFCPRQLVLSVAGDLTPAELKKAVQNSFFRVTPSPERRSIHNFNETLKESRRTLMPNGRDGQTYYLMGFLAPAAGDEDWAPMTVISGLLGSGNSGRLFRRLRQREGCCYYVGCKYPVLLRQSHIYLYAATGAGSADMIRDRMLEITEDLKKTPVEQADIDRVVTYMLTQEDIDRENLLSLSHLTALEEVYGSRDARTARLRKVTPEDVTRCAEKYFTHYAEAVLAP